MKTMKKQRELQPELEKIKEKYKYDKQKQAEEQMKFFKQHGLNPASGCFSQIIMILVLFALYGVIQGFTKGGNGDINTVFFYLNLGQPDPIYALPILAGLVTLVSSKMMQPYVEKGEKLAKKTADKSDDLAYNMQEQMLYLMPVMTVVITLRLPSGIALYLLVTTIFSVVQQYFVSGWGGMRPIINKLKWKN
jgi:YidC/Oxa1 family membrane protein insertase